MLTTAKELPNTDVVPHYLVGEEAFPLQRHLMRPYPGTSLAGPQADKRRMFNYRLGRVRRCVENALGIAVQRWRMYTMARWAVRRRRWGRW